MFYNQPKLCPNATWEVNATTYANETVVNTPSHGFFIDINDTVYFPNHNKNWILVWTINSTNPIRNLSIQLHQYTCLFTTFNDDIYFENGNQRGRIDKWKVNATRSDFVVKFDGNCIGLFIGINNSLYCSMYPQHQVASIFLNSNVNMSTTIAGNGSNGTGPYQLNLPWEYLLVSTLTSMWLTPETIEFSCFDRDN